MKRLWYILPLLVVLIVVYFGVQPYLSMHKPVNKGVLVVEGWLDTEYMKNVSHRFNNGDYNHIVTTGTPRPFTYYLHNQDRMEFGSFEGASGFLEVAGTEGTRLAILYGNDTLIDIGLVEEVIGYELGFAPLPDSLVFIVHSEVSTDWSFQIGFIRSFTIDGRNAHSVFNKINWTDYAGRPKHIHPSYADYARHELMGYDIPGDRIIAVPADSIGTGGRTKSNAAAFAEYAERNPLLHADLITLGVHARRSYLNYRDASNIGDFGVFSIPDKSCPRNSWIMNRYGRYKVSKELGALFFGTAVNPLMEEDE